MSRTSLPGTQRLKGLFSQTPIPGTPTSLVPARRVLPPGVRLALMAVLFLLVIALASGVRSIAGHQPVLAVLAGAVVAVGGLAAYAAAVRALEQRAVSELDLARAVPELRTGGLVGVGLFTATLTLIAVFGTYAPESGGSIGGMLAVLGMMAGVAVTEEVLFRGSSSGWSRNSPARASHWPCRPCSSAPSTWSTRGPRSGAPSRSGSRAVC